MQKAEYTSFKKKAELQRKTQVYAILKKYTLTDSKCLKYKG